MSQQSSTVRGDRGRCGSGHQFHKPKLKELCRYSDAVSSYWRQLALELDLPSEIIDRIDKDRDRVADKCYDMFKTWLQRSPDACWCHIVNALKMCNMLQMAKNIEETFLSANEATQMDIASSCNQSSVEDIGDDFILQIVLPHAIHWKEIGILLDVDSKQLEELEKTYPNDFIRCCKEMINKWLQTDRNVSQRKLLACLKLATLTPLLVMRHQMFHNWITQQYLQNLKL